MSTLRVFVFCLAALIGIGSGAAPAVAQTDDRPIYLFTGQVESKDFTWTDRPEEATVRVFRESVPETERGGRVLGRSVEEARRQLPEQAGAYLESTALTTRPHPSYPGEALRTRAEYPSGDARYLLLIEIGGERYVSRPLGSAMGNLPRYHTLEDPADVRVDQVHRDLERAAGQLLSAIESSRDINGEEERAHEKSAVDTGENSNPPDSSTGGEDGSRASESEKGLVEALLTGRTLWWGGSGLFGGLMFLLGMTVAGSGGSGGNSSSRRRPPNMSSGEHPLNQSSQLRAGSQDDEEEIDERVQALVEEQVEERVEEQLEAIREAVTKMYKNQVEPLQRRVEALEERLEEQDAPQADDASSAERVDPSEAVVAAFMKWCRSAGSRVRKVEAFREFLDENTQVEEAGKIQYEKDAAGDEFVDDARNGITYWLVRTEGRQYVLPSPLNGSRFDKLEPVFEGRAQPDTIDGLRPAELERRAGRLVLAEKGEVW